jgi:hypothetical protein
VIKQELILDAVDIANAISTAELGEIRTIAEKLPVSVIHKLVQFCPGVGHIQESAINNAAPDQMIEGLRCRTEEFQNHVIISLMSKSVGVNQLAKLVTNLDGSTFQAFKQKLGPMTHDALINHNKKLSVHDLSTLIEGLDREQVPELMSNISRTRLSDMAQDMGYERDDEAETLPKGVHFTHVVSVIYHDYEKQIGENVEYTLGMTIGEILHRSRLWAPNLVTDYNLYIRIENQKFSLESKVETRITGNILVWDKDRFK